MPSQRVLSCSTGFTESANVLKPSKQTESEKSKSMFLLWSGSMLMGRKTQLVQDRVVFCQRRSATTIFDGTALSGWKKILQISIKAFRISLTAKSTVARNWARNFSTYKRRANNPPKSHWWSKARNWHTQYSSYTHLVRITTRVFCVVTRSYLFSSTPLSVDELSKEKFWLCKQDQAQMFPDTVETLKRKRALPLDSWELLGALTVTERLPFSSSRDSSWKASSYIFDYTE